MFDIFDAAFRFVIVPILLVGGMIIFMGLVVDLFSHESAFPPLTDDVDETIEKDI